jgi:hypothetical protein
MNLLALPLLPKIASVINILKWDIFKNILIWDISQLVEIFIWPINPGMKAEKS